MTRPNKTRCFAQHFSYWDISRIRHLIPRRPKSVITAPPCILSCDSFELESISTSVSTFHYDGRGIYVLIYRWNWWYVHSSCRLNTDCTTLRGVYKKTHLSTITWNLCHSNSTVEAQRSMLCNYHCTERPASNCLKEGVGHALILCEWFWYLDKIAFVMEYTSWCLHFNGAFA